MDDTREGGVEDGVSGMDRPVHLALYSTVLALLPELRVLDRLSISYREVDALLNIQL